MKNIMTKAKYPLTLLTFAIFTFANSTLVFATDRDSSSASSGGSGAMDFSGAASPVVSLINSLIGPVISVVVAVGAIYCVILGVKLAKADEPQEREKAKMALKNAIIGFFLIFILIVVMRLMVPTLVKWVENSTKTTMNVTY